MKIQQDDPFSFDNYLKKTNRGQKLTAFVKMHKEDIRKNNWGIVYFDANIEKLPGELSEMMRRANIDPLQYINYVPHSYYKYSKETQIVIPEGIEVLNADCFSHTYPIARVFLPKSLTDLDISIFNEMCVDQVNLIYPKARNTFEQNVTVYSRCRLHVTCYTADSSLNLNNFSERTRGRKRQTSYQSGFFDF